MIIVIDYKEALPIRQAVMWPEYPLSFSEIKNDPEGYHFGYLVEDKLVSVISLFIENDEAQFRKFATLESHQGNGIGTQLLSYIISFAKEKGIHRIWCNARIDKSGFYEKFGLEKTQETFEKEGQYYVVMEKYLYSK
ncbi:MAG: GNAT family N-acetyltransferase [Clostridia bacterium]|nr:GNAT family N-acetyltransferase [Clostridia bacterium]